MVSRGPEATAAALSPLVEAVGALASIVECPWAAVPKEGEVVLGARVVGKRGGGFGLVPGEVHVVDQVGTGKASWDRRNHGPLGSCTLRRCRDGQALLDLSGQPKWFPMSGLALAGGPLQATPLLLSCLLGCPGEVVSLVLARQPEAAAMVDALGRTPLVVACEVRGRSLSLSHPLCTFLFSSLCTPLLIFVV